MNKKAFLNLFKINSRRCAVVILSLLIAGTLSSCKTAAADTKGSREEAGAPRETVTVPETLTGQETAAPPETGSSAFPENGTADAAETTGTGTALPENSPRPVPGDDYSFAGYEWAVLDVCGAEEIAVDKDLEGTACLLFMKEEIGPLPYNEEMAVVSWETCSLRKYLNTEFLENNFPPEDRERVLAVKLDNSSCTYLENYQSRGGNDTEDRCFALSVPETEKYSGLIGSALGRAGYYSSFWLRTSMKEGADYGALMYREGTVYEDMNPVTYPTGVHPVMWVLLQH